jgi:hypothetical protein
MTVILIPGLGLLSWREFEQGLGWSNFFVIASSSKTLAGSILPTESRVWQSPPPILAGSAADSRDPILYNPPLEKPPSCP